MPFLTEAAKSSSLLLIGTCVALLSTAPGAIGQTSADAKPQPDVLILIDGETLLGHLASAQGGSVIFHSDLLGNLTMDWSKIRSLYTQGRYAVVEKDLILSPGTDLSKIPTGSIEATAQTIAISPGAGTPKRTFAVADTAEVMEEAALQKQIQSLREPSLLQAWKGTVTAGASLVVATQQSRTFTGALNFIRAIPAESSLPPHNRTILNFAATNGFLIQPGTPKLKTEILHADAERDQYFHASHIFGFGQVAFDRNFSQGLRLQESYGAGIGWTVIKGNSQTLDVKGSLDFLRQRFQDPVLDQRLIASIFSENYTRKFGRGLTVLEQLSVTPTWNNLHAWLSSANSAFTIPIYRRLTFTVSLGDSFLHNPEPGFRKNSFQATTGLTYTLR